MSVNEDIAGIIEQENSLVFKSFDEEKALAIGLEIKRLIEARGKAVSIDIRLWDRQIFGFAMKGTTADNHEWMRRKINAVKRYHRASYRLMLERGGEDAMKPRWGIDHADYVFAGGSFPLCVEGIGCVGAVTVSGLTGREDHALAVEALCAILGANHDELALRDK